MSPAPALAATLPRRARTARRAGQRASAATPARALSLRPVSLAIGLLVTAPVVWALPTGAVNTGGQASVQLSAPGQLDIRQGSPRASLDWTSFSIAAGEVVNVMQPDRSSVLLNRVVGNDPSLIYGALRSNGSVWLINPRGIVFGASSRVDVGGLVASTLEIRGDALASGRLQLGASSGAGELRSDGQITAIDGTVALAAPQLLQGGQITARRVGLVAASEVLVDVEGDGLVFFNVRNQGLDTRLAVLGRVLADGGTADIRAAARAGFADTVLNLDGVVQARSIGVREGRIVVDGGSSGATRVAGTLDASAGAGSRGGSITVQGDHLHIAGSARLDASGAAGGGTLLVGGDFQGANGAVRNASHTTVARGALLLADATAQGDGGRVIVWSDDTTVFDGRASVRGGAGGGHGGFVETSGKLNLGVQHGAVDVSAAAGHGGQWLLDPLNIIVATAGASATYPDVQTAGAQPGTTQTVAPATLVAVGGTVTLAATNDITVTDAITLTAPGAGLTLNAGNAITLNASVSTLTSNGAIAMSSGSGGITQAALTSIDAGSNTISLNAGGGDLTLGGSLLTSNTTAAAIALSNAANLQLGDVATGGNAGTLRIDFSGTGSQAAGSGIGAGNLRKQGSGTLTLDSATNTYTGATVLEQGSLNLSTAIASTSLSVTGGTLATTAADLLPATAVVSVATGGTLLLGAANTVTSLSLGGSLAAGAALTTSGATTLTAGASVDAALNAGSLAVTGNSTLNAAVTVAGNASVGSGVQLSVGSGGAAGSLLVTGTSTVDGRLVLNRDSALDATDLIGTGTLTGSGTLRQAGSGSVTLNRSTGTLGSIDITGSGGLTLSGAARIADSAAVTVGSGATLTMGSDAETVGSLTLTGGALAGVGALSAGALSSSGSSSLAAPVTAASLTVTGGTLTLSAALVTDTVNVDAGTLATSATDLLADTAAVSVVGGATLTLGGADSIATLALGGTLGGTAALTSTGATTLSAGAAVNTALNAASLVVTGNATLTADVAVAGTTGVTAGTLRVGAGSTGSLASTGTLTVADSATLEYNRSGSFTQNGIAGGGTLQLTAGAMTLGGAATGLARVQVDGGSLTLAGAGSQLGNTATLALNGGSFALANNVDETVGNVTLSGTLAAAGTARLTSSTGSYALGAGAQVDGRLGTGTVTVSGSGTATLNADINAGTLNVNGSATLALGPSAVLSSNADVAVLGAGGRLSLGSNTAVRTLTLAGTLGGAFRISTSDGSTLNTGAVVEAASEITGGQVAVNGDATLAGLVDANVRVNNGGTLRLTTDRPTATPNLSDHIVDSRNLNLRPGGSIQLAVNERVNEVTGSGTRIGPGLLLSTIYYLDGDSVGNLDTGELVSDGLSFITGTVTVAGTATVNTGTLTVGSGSNGSLSAGGGITVNTGAVLALNRSDTATLAATVSGLGTLRQAGSGELQITGVTDLPFVEVTGGSLSLASGNDNRLGNGTALTIASGRTLRLDNSGETVATLNLSGTLAGTGVLTATTYNLLGGSSVNAALGAGALEVSGASALNRAAAAATVVVRNTGALTLSASGSLSSAADVLIETGGTLTLAADSSVNRLSAGGRLAGSGHTLTALAASNGYTLSTGAQIDANLGTGTLTVNGNATLNGSTQAATLNLAGGTLVLGGSGGRLANPAAVLSIDAAAGSGLTLSGAESVASFSSAGSLAGGARLLTVSGAITLQSGAVVNADLAGATLSASGGVVLGRAVTVGTASVDNGTLSGSGTLTAGSTTLQGNSTVGAALAGGSLVVASGSSTLTGTAAVATLDVTSGASLTLASADRFTAAPVAQLGGSLTLNGNQALGSLAGSGTLALGGATLSTGSAGSSTFNGSIGGSGGGLTKLGYATTFTLGGSQSYGGVTTVSEGTLQLANAEVLANGSSLAVAAPTLAGSAVLALAGTGSVETVSTLTLAGTLAGTGTLQAGSYVLAGGNTTAGTRLGSGQIVATGNSTLAGDTLADLRVDSGRLTLASAARLANPAAAVEVRSGAALTLGGDQNIDSLVLAGTLDGSGRLTAASHTLQTGATVDADLGGSLLTVIGNALLDGNAQVSTLAVASDATLTLGATPDRIANGAAVTLATRGQLVLGGDETVGTLTLAGTLASAGRKLTATTYTLEPGAQVLADLGPGTLSVLGSGTLGGSGDSRLAGSADAASVFVDGGTLVLGSANRLAPDATVTVAAPATLQIGGDESLRQLNLLGRLNGATGTLTATAASGYVLDGGNANAALGSGTLNVSGASLLNASAAAGSVNVLAGATLTLGASGQFNAAPLVDIAATGALALGSAQTFGGLSGSGNLALGSHTLSTGNSGNTSFDGLLSGSGGLVKQGSGDFSLGGSQAYGGSTRVAAGTLVLQGDNVLPDGSAVTVLGAATLSLGGSDSVASLTLAGTLAGAGTLTAADTTLQEGAATTANAHLGAGTLTVLGNATLAGTKGAGNLTVNTNAGTLTLAGADRLDDTVAVTVRGGAALALNGNDSVASLTLAGTLAGSGHTLTAGLTTLQTGAVVNANLGAGTLQIDGDATLAGSAASSVVHLRTGSFTLDSAGRLSAGASVDVDSGASLLLAGDESVATLTLAGTLGNAGARLSASSYTLEAGAQVLANLGPGTLTVTGDSTLAGAAAAGTVNVDTGTLTLGAADRLDDNAAVAVAGGATLRLLGNDKVGSLALSGTLEGGFTLSADSYLLNGGSYNAPLGEGELISTGNSRLNATSGAGVVTVSSGTLTLGAGNLFTAAPALTVAGGATLNLGGDESVRTLAGAGNVALAGHTLTSTGAADSSYAGSLSGSGGFVKLGSTTFTLSGSNTYTGSTRIDEGVLALTGTLASQALAVNGGTLLLSGDNALSDSAAVTVASGALMTLAGTDTLGSLTLFGTLDGAGSLTAATVALRGGTADIARLGTGALVSSGSSRLNSASAAGTVAIEGGTLTLGAGGRFSLTPTVNLAGTANLVLGGNESFGSLAGSGTLALGSHTLRTGAGGENSSFDGVLSGTGGLVKQGSATFTLGGAHSYTGSTRVEAGSLQLTGTLASTSLLVADGGTLALGAAERLADSASVDVRSGATLLLGGNQTVGQLVLAGSVAGTGRLTAASYSLDGGSVDTELGSGSLSSTGASRVAAAVGATTVAVNGGSLTLAAADLLADGATVTVAGTATMALGGAERIAGLNLAGSLAGNGTLTADTYTLDSGSVAAGAALGRGALRSSGSSQLAGTAAVDTLAVDTGTFTLASAGRLVGSTAATVASGATLALTGNQSLTSLALAGTLAGDGVLDAASVTLDSGLVLAGLGGGTLRSTGNSTLAGSAASTALDVDSGTLTLASAGRLSAAPLTRIATSATLALGGDENLGTLAGGGSVTLGSATLNTGSRGDSRFDGVLSGSGALAKSGSGSFTLGGANLHTGSTTVLEGTLATAAADVLPDGSGVDVASGARLQLGGDDTVATLTLAGTLDGNTTLSATTYTLAGGTANANLGRGQLFSNGSSTLAGTAAAAEVSVDSGSLTLVSANRLADDALLRIARNATLALGGDDTVTRADIAGTLTGSGTLEAQLIALDGGRVDAALGRGALTSTGGSTLNGSSLAGVLNVDGGTLTLSGTQRLGATPAVTLAAGAGLVLGGDETLGSLAGSGGLNLGAATLRSGVAGDSSYGGVMAGSGGFVKQGGGSFTLAADQAYTGPTTVDGGSLVLAGTLATQAVQVNAGTLALAAAERLADTSLVTVATGARLTLAGDEHVARLVLAGTLAGSGRLSAASYTLNSGNVDADLGTGALQSSGDSRLDGNAAVTTLAVNAGTLTLGSADRLSALPATTVAGGATLQLAGSQAVGTLAGDGSVGLAGHTLTSAGLADSSFAGRLEGSGGLVKQGSTVFTLSGASGYTGSTRVEGGTLVLTGTLASLDVNVTAGTLQLIGSNRLADAANVTVASGALMQMAGVDTLANLTLSGSLIGTGGLVATSYTLNGGTASVDTLGPGLLRSSGSSTLNSASAAGTVLVEAGTLTLGTGSHFSAAPAVTVAGGATLALGGTETLGTLAGGGGLALASHTLFTGSGGSSSFAGVLGGSGELVKQGDSRFTLGGANTSTGATRVLAGTLQLDGSLSSTALVISPDATVALTAPERLPDTALVDVRSRATLTLAGNETVASLLLAGTLAGSGTLTAASYSLDGGSANTELGTGTLTATGSSRLAAASAAGSVAVNGGTLTLAAGNLLADSAAVSIARDATLALDAADTVARLTLAGTLAGSGTLTAANYALDGATVNANLGAGTLSSLGSSLLAGNAAVGSVAVQGGSLALAAAQRFTAAPAVQLDAGSTLALVGDQSLGTLAGSGTLALGAFTLSTGGGGDSSFAGVIGGSGGLIKQGSSSIFTLTGASTYTGATQVAAGTLRLGDNGNSGSLATSNFDLTGLLELARADDVALPQPVAGSGGVRQAGAGRLLFSGNNKTYGGDTTVARGELATAGADELPDGSAVGVAADGRLTLGGRESLRSLTADGPVALAGDLAASGDLLLRGAVTSSGPLQLSGERIEAVNAGNRYTGALALDARGAVLLAAGEEGGVARELVLGTVRVADGGRIEAGRLTLGSDTSINGGTLQLVASAPATAIAPDAALANKQAIGLPIAWAGDAVLADTGSRVEVAAGAALDIVASGGGSVRLLDAGNNFAGSLSVVSGAPDTPWSVNTTSLAFGSAAQNYAVQSRVQLNGLTLNIGGVGIVADVVNLRADRVATLGSDATLVTRLPFDSAAGTVTSLPGLTLELSPEAYNLSFPFGAPGADGGLRVNVGSRAYGNRTLPLDAGYVAVLPRDGARGTTAVLLLGPTVNPAGGYRFFFDGAGKQSEIPVFYNGVLPTTPQVENSLSAAVAVSESARKERFDEAVRTENVAVRLRSGVIAEVGPAPSATQGTEGLRVPASCPPQGSTLGCAKAP